MPEVGHRLWRVFVEDAEVIAGKFVHKTAAIIHLHIDTDDRCAGFKNRLHVLRARQSLAKHGGGEKGEESSHAPIIAVFPQSLSERLLI